MGRGAEKKEELTENGIRLSPRGSFDTWREDVRHKSLPWTSGDLVVADSIRSYVRDVMLSHNDATEEQRERNEQQRNRLNSEMTHRVKNILALVKSIATQTGSSSDSIDDYTRSFEGRLRALAYAHDQSFAGAEGGELADLIEAEAAMHRFGNMPDRIQVSGEPLGLSEHSFGVFALLLHEMMTNAAKYGSLSVPSGKLDVSWSLTDEGDCRLLWIESGGPEVITPTRRGFGSNLIEKTIAHDLGGTVDIDFDPAGLRATIVLPSEHLRAVSGDRRAVEANPDTAVTHLDGLRVLLVEDQSLIAMDTEELLRALGAAEVTVAANVKSALASIAVSAPDCAVLDLNLGGTTSEDVARELGRLRVPYVFATGYRDGSSVPEGFEAIPVVRKPVSENSLSVALSSVVATER